VTARRKASPKAELTDVGDVAERILTIRVPQRVAQGRDRGSPETEAHITLRVRLAGGRDGDQQGLSSTVALVRGSGMVVRYLPVRVPLSERSYHAVLLAGTAHGSSDSDRALERFLRAAEPVSHNDWRPDTDRMIAEFRRGATARLSELWRDVERAIVQLVGTEPADSTEGPSKLAELFPLRGKGPAATVERFRTADLTAILDSDMWRFSGRVRHTPRRPSEWEFDVTALLDSESGPGEPLRIVSFTCDVGSISQLDGAWRCEVPRACREVQFSGEAHPQGAGGKEDLGRIRLQLDISARERQAAL